MHILRLDADIIACRARFSLTDFCFHEPHIRHVDSSGRLGSYEFMDRTAFLQIFRRFHAEMSGNTVHQQYITHHVFVTHSYIARGFVCHMHIVMLVDKALERTAHRNDIIVRMR